MSESTPAAPITPAPTAPRTPASTATLSGPQAELTEAEAVKMSGWVKQDLAAGKLTPGQSTKMFNELGRTMEQREPDARTDEQKELDAAFPPGKPSDYRIVYGNPGEDVPQTPELKQFDTNASTWMARAGLPRDLGNTLVTTISRVIERTHKMTPAELDSYGEVEYAKLEKVFGRELDAKLRSAGLMVEDLEKQRPGLKHLLKRRGIGDNALVVAQLIQHSERYHARKAR